MNSYLLKEIPEHLAALAVEGYHRPGSLTQASGAWIQSAGSTCFLPGGDKRCEISTEEDTRCLWIALEGPLSPMVVRKMGALLHMPLKQGALPSQIYLAEQIV